MKSRLLNWAPVAVALLMLGLILIPAGLWQSPLFDSTYTGFDPNLVYAPSQPFSAIKVSAQSVDVAARPGGEPQVLLATTPLHRFIASVDVTVSENQGALTPFRIGLWSPWGAAGYFVTFGPSPGDRMTADSVVRGLNGISLTAGEVVGQSDLGTYQVGSTYRVELALDKDRGVVTARVSSGVEALAVASVESKQNPKLFVDSATSLSASALAGLGSSRVLLERYEAQLPHERLWASKIDDPKAQALLIALAVVGVVVLVIAVPRRLRSRPRFVRPQISLGAVAVVAGCAIAYGAGNALLFPLGGHPFDMPVEQLYAYVSRTYGPAQLYFLPNIVSLPKLWSGVPLEEFAFPYQPVFVYLFTASGWINSALLGGSTFRLDSAQLEYVIKAVNVLFGFADGLLIHWTMRQIGSSRRWALLAAGLWLFNPAVWFSMSVWGQTHVISLFFVLAAVLLVERRHPLGAWLALSAAVLTRPQMLVFGVLLGVVLLRKFPWRENVFALSWTVVAVFLAILPLTLAISPSLPVDVMVNTLRSHETGAPGLVTAVSQDAYSVWPLVEYVTQGATGFHQAFNPSNVTIAGPINFQRLGQLLTLTAVLILAVALWVRRRSIDEPGAYLPYLALGAMSFVMLFFGIIATHFLLPLPFILLSRRWMGTMAYLYAAVAWTVTTLVTMYGDLGQSILASEYPRLVPANNAVTGFFVALYTSDRFITVGIVANICAVAWLAYLVFRRQVTETGVLATAS